ncbi:hypothetical protein ACB098_11G071800 [Castanea mollissima]
MALLVHSPEISTLPKFFCNPNPRNPISFVTLRNNRMVGSRDRVRVRVSELDQGLNLSGLFSAPVKRGSKPSKEEEDKQNYYVNMGYAIRTLREEFPGIFYKELTFDIYRDDIVFKDPLNTFSGIENYKSIFWALRFHGRIFFKALWVDIISVWQPKENIMMVRWTVHGIPRVLWESCGRFDATSVYKFDKKGKIFEHCVDNIAFNSPSKFRVLAVEELIQTLGCPSTPKPTYFEISFPSSSKRTYYD